MPELISTSVRVRGAAKYTASGPGSGSKGAGQDTGADTLGRSGRGEDHGGKVGLVAESA